jgi:hypothetical protein
MAAIEIKTKARAKRKVIHGKFQCVKINNSH